MKNNIINLAHGKKSDIEFDISISGVSIENERVMLSIDVGEYFLSIPCQKKTGTLYEVTIPDILDRKIYKFKLQVVVNEYFFEPFSGSICIGGVPDVSANIFTGHSDVAEEQPEIDNGPITIDDESVETTPERSQQSITFTIPQMNTDKLDAVLNKISKEREQPEKVEKDDKKEIDQKEVKKKRRYKDDKAKKVLDEIKEERSNSPEGKAKSLIDDITKIKVEPAKVQIVIDDNVIGPSKEVIEAERAVEQLLDEIKNI